METHSTTNRGVQVAAFGGGCFWCTEAVFEMLKGVTTVRPGYTGGTTPNPTYEDVCSGTTGHAEVVYVEYDPNIIDFRKLLIVFFASHDPSQLNRQGNDIGTQYRSVIFYTTEEQRRVSLEMIKEINNSSSSGNPVVTELEKLGTFYEAEQYHKNYFMKNKDKGYCQLIINPKVEKVQKQFADLLKENK